MSRRPATPLLIGTLVLRINSGAVTVVLGLFLAQLATHAGRAITSVQVGLLPTAFFISELVLAPLMGALGDRWGRRYFLIFGPIPGLIEVSLFPFTPTVDPLPYLLALQVLAAFSSAMNSRECTHLRLPRSLTGCFRWSISWNTMYSTTKRGTRG